jgi:hypothetical protein
MEGSEFLIYFQNLPLLMPHFLGVYSIDTMPRRMKVRSFFITNLSKSHNEGTHWIAVIKPRKGHLEIFDSLSFRPDLVMPYLNFTENLKIDYNQSELQSNNSILCGKFVITFCVERMMNLDLSFNMLLDDVFLLNKESNDKIVTDFCEELLKLT